MTDKILVLSTASSPDEAARLARALVDAHLAACVNVVPGASSVYRWKGEVEQAAECLLLIKSRRALFERLQLEIRKHHSYEVPEVIALPIIDGSPGYLEWLERETLAS